MPFVRNACRPIAAAFLLAAAGTSGRAQMVDAGQPGGGVLRIGVLSWWYHWSERYGVDTPGRQRNSPEPLGVDFTTDSLGPRQVEQLGAIQGLVRSAAAMPGFNASLGKTIVNIRNDVQVSPFSVELGITSRLSLTALVPFVTAASRVDARINPTGREATVGFNPNLAAPSIITATGLLLSQFDTASSRLGSRLTSCAASPASPGCASLNANADAARALIAQANAFALDLSRLYGGRNGSAGSPFVPVAGTTAQSAIDARVAAFRAQFAALGADVITSSAGPPGAQAPFTITDLQRLLTDSTGIGARPLATSIRRGVGDIDLGARLTLFDTYNDTAGRGGRLRWRQTFEGIYRLGTGAIDDPADFADQGTGDRQSDIEIRSYTDVRATSHFAFTLAARFNMQMADVRTMRITDSPADVWAARYRQQRVNRDLGDEIGVTFEPRYSLGESLTLAAQYTYSHKGADHYSGKFTVTDLTGASKTLDASWLDEETEATEHRFGGGATYSTVAAWKRGQASAPLEFSYLHYQTTAAAGGNVPKLVRDEVRVRWFIRLFGRR